MTIDLEELQRFITQSEGADPPYFAGWQAELDLIANQARDLWVHFERGLHRSLSKRSHIVYGAPGAGKSSLLSELGRRLHADEQSTGQPRLLYENSADFMADPSRCLHRIEKLSNLNTSKWTERLRTLSYRIRGTINLGLINASLNRDETASHPPSSVMELADRMPPERWETPLILAIDEFQNIGGEATSPHILALQSLHEATCGLPIMLVAAGLGGTIKQAKALGLTRGVKSIGIGCLSDSESLDLVYGWCRRYGINTEKHEHELNRLASDAEGWPRHLHHSLQALAKSLVQPNSDGRLDQVDWQSVSSAAARLRKQYYRHQMSPQMQQSTALLAAVMKDLTTNSGNDALLESVERHTSSHQAAHWRLPEDMTPAGYLDHLMHQGRCRPMTTIPSLAPFPAFDLT